MLGIGKLINDGVSLVFGNAPNDGLIRMFEVEYSKEYHTAVNAGIKIDTYYVKEFLKTVE